VDISFVETLNTVSALLKEIPATRVLFGSHTPFLYTRSAIMKIKAAEISQEDLDAITYGNAQRLIKLNEGACK
jgi:predicted TIM-barrel fold metal-dependent hydrolase